MIILIALATLVATLCGGLFAFWKRDSLHLILGFSAGAVIGVAFFDLLPESIDLATKHYDLSQVTAVTAVGFLLYMLLSRVILLHPHTEHDDDCDTTGHRGILGAASLSLHSFLDGIGIGLAFQVSPAVGVVVAAAVLAHDFSDGINTVTVILRDKGRDRRALIWLGIDAVAPVLGVLATFFFTVPGPELGLLLALFAGFFLYIGAGDLLPESHHHHPKFITSVMTVAGAVVIFLAVHFAGF
ncbi:MAG: ZIP family metal transporter [bacterium]